MSLDETVIGESKSKDYWGQTGLNLSTLQSVVNRETCYVDEMNFLGCMQALTAILTLTSQQEVDVSFPVSKIKKGIFHLSDIQARPLPKKSFQDIADVLEDFKVSTAKQIEKWQALYRQTKNRPIHFYQILEDVIIPYNKQGQEDDKNHWFWAFFKGLFFHQKVALKPEKLIAQAINSYLSITNSPHDRLIPLDLVKDHSQESEGEYRGIGLFLFQLQQHLIVKEVIEGGPAFQAGLQPGDIISKVQGQDVSGMAFLQPSQAIARAAGQVVQLEVLRKGVRRHFQVKKKIINVDNVKTEFLQDRGQKWGLIKISSFYKADTCNQVEQAIYDFQKDSSVSGLVIDLRNNPGGLVDEALCTADLFLPEHRFMLEIRPFDNNVVSKLSFSLLPQATDLPLVILINAGSASSAEIVAGVLRDHNRSVLIGERSFGKGTILQGIAFQPPKYPGLIHYHTSGKFYFPSRRTNHIVGITPDHTVKFKNDSLVLFREEDLFVYKLPSFSSKQLLTEDMQAVSQRGGFRQNTFQGYQNCLDDLKTFKGQQEAKTLATTMLRCVAAQKAPLT